ncbi:MAG: hypothetical protein J3K34DRAFT_409372, partial [Monoraphidium minutum]
MAAAACSRGSSGRRATARGATRMPRRRAPPPATRAMARRSPWRLRATARWARRCRSLPSRHSSGAALCGAFWGAWRRICATRWRARLACAPTAAASGCGTRLHMRHSLLTIGAARARRRLAVWWWRAREPRRRRSALTRVPSTLRLKRPSPPRACWLRRACWRPWDPTSTRPCPTRRLRTCGPRWRDPPRRAR